MAPNVILIVLDSVRADSLEPYGAPSGSSPAIAALADRGYASPHAYAPASWTVPSHAAMFSGRMSRELGLGQAPEGTPQGCRPAMERVSEQLLPAVMRRNGYETRAVSSNLWLRPASGFDIGFDEFRTVETERRGRPEGKTFGERARWRLEAALANRDDGARQAAAIFRTWAQEPRERPFFWFVNLVESHSPYLPPRPYNSLRLRDRVRAANEASTYLTLDAIWQACAGGLEVPDEAIARMKQLYADAIRYLDRWVADLLETLSRAGILDETLIIVTGDHGDNFGEDGLMAHAFSLDERLIHIPFVSAGPVQVGHDRAFSLVDLPRMLTTALALDESPYGDRVSPGIAVAEFDRPAPIDHPAWQARLKEWGLGPEAGDRVATSFTAATDGRWKLIRPEGGEDLVFDLQADPAERKPIEKTELDPGMLGRLEDAVAGSAASSAPQAATPNPELSSEERAQLEDQMRLLGYL